ncbi:ubiquinol-cytochrome-c reductase complex assembly factor 2 [Cotesia glomerata]|uniref:ubiquinol-cytochrome-c reductase complex assembly factor 2 n=1 Tax=Cotesia glomerata TaxID=32391 RepID=UPI001D00AB4F|nr:ubiquinol-cytochrome-c reductase complex assembly factor 2 [Cotesia glomerata]
MAGTYKNYLKLLEAWPVDKYKPGRDLGEYIRDRIKLEFSTNKVRSQAEKEECDRNYVSLKKISSNHYAKLYPRKLNSSGTGLSYEQCSCILSPEILENYQRQKRNFFQRILDYAAKPDDKNEPNNTK